jgi:hypothetical protein
MKTDHRSIHLSPGWCLQFGLPFYLSLLPE